MARDAILLYVVLSFLLLSRCYCTFCFLIPVVGLLNFFRLPVVAGVVGLLKLKKAIPYRPWNQLTTITQSALGPFVYSSRPFFLYYHSLLLGTVFFVSCKMGTPF